MCHVPVFPQVTPPKRVWSPTIWDLRWAAPGGPDRTTNAEGRARLHDGTPHSSTRELIVAREAPIGTATSLARNQAVDPVVRPVQPRARAADDRVPRACQVLALVPEGLTNAEIGADCGSPQGRVAVHTRGRGGERRSVRILPSGACATRSARHRSRKDGRNEGGSKSHRGPATRRLGRGPRRDVSPRS